METSSLFIDRIVGVIRLHGSESTPLSVRDIAQEIKDQEKSSDPLDVVERRVGAALAAAHKRPKHGLQRRSSGPPKNAFVYWIRELPQPKKYKQNKLTSMQTHIFYGYAKEHYTASKLNDAKFADLAAKELGFPVSKGNVIGACRDLKIVPNEVSTRTMATGNLVTRLLQLEQHVIAQDARLKHLEDIITGLAGKYPGMVSDAGMTLAERDHKQH
jgi:hypothetical protein